MLFLCLNCSDTAWYMRHIAGTPAESVVQLYQFQFLYAQSYAGLVFFLYFCNEN
jgi:hypothetical protein